MASPRPPGRPRSPRAHRAVLEAVIHLLGDRGFGGMSVEAVALRAGVSKATIYRHWASKEALCMEAVACVVVDAPEGRGEDPRRELEALLSGFVEALERSQAGRLLPHLASAAATDRQLAAIWRETLVEPARRRVDRLLRRAVDAGQLGAGADLDLAGELLLAPLFYRRLVTGAPAADRAFVRRLVTAVWDVWPAE
jgi:AcrR family transcriptional regulator